MRLLCAGDIHLGRQPSRIPAEHVADQKRFSTASGWQAIVDLAIAEAVDLVAISGDLVDHDNRFYEALGPVEAGVKTLIDHGIPVVAVAGNHDFDTAPTFATRLGDGFRLLGQQQRWERHTIRDADGRPHLHIDGWSFANEHVADDPSATYPFPPASDAPVLGLLHADLDAVERRYAAVKLSGLRRLPVTCWLLGHIHVPRIWQEPGQPDVLYPGSPFPLDPGESGKHGVWMLEIERDQAPRFTFRPIARHRYQLLTVDLTGIEHAREAGQRVADAVRELHDSALAEPDGEALEYLLVRVILTGAVPVGLDLAGEMEQLKAGFRLPSGSIETIRDATEVCVDLDALAGEKSPPGEVARIILSLRDGTTPHALVAMARQETDAVRRHASFSDVVDEPAVDPMSALETASWQLLNALLAQREHAS